MTMTLFLYFVWAVGQTAELGGVRMSERYES